MGEQAKVRLQRVLADAGVAARRACESMIEQGRVQVNGRKVDRLPAFVDPGSDRITVDGRPVQLRARKLYILLHKPTRTLATTADAPGSDRQTVIDLVDHPAKPRLFPVGRLDYDATGLLLLTNDGDFANRITHPRYGVAKTYEAVVRGPISPDQQGQIERELGKAHRRMLRTRAGLSARPTPREEGMNPVDASTANTASLEVIRREGENVVLRITLQEGRNRQLGDILAGAGCRIRKLTRVGIGTLQLRGLAPGAWRELSRDELRGLTRPAGGAKPYPPKADRSASHGAPAAPRRPRPSRPNESPDPRPSGRPQPASPSSRPARREPERTAAPQRQADTSPLIFRRRKAGPSQADDE